MDYDGLKLLNEISEGDCRGAAAISIHKHLAGRVLMKAEVKIPPATPHGRGARLDMALYDPTSFKMLLILEIKRRANSRAWRQGMRYSDLTGVPVIYLNGMAECEQAAQRVAKALKMDIPNLAQSGAAPTVRVFNPPKLDADRDAERARWRSDRMGISRDKLSGG